MNSKKLLAFALSISLLFTSVSNNNRTIPNKKIECEKVLELNNNKKSRK